jgi:RecJ-like exonuclease
MERFMGTSPEDERWKVCPECAGSGEIEGTEAEFVQWLMKAYEEEFGNKAIIDGVREYYLNEIVPCCRCGGCGSVEVE